MGQSVFRLFFSSIVFQFGSCVNVEGTVAPSHWSKARHVKAVGEDSKLGFLGRSGELFFLFGGGGQYQSCSGATERLDLPV